MRDARVLARLWPFVRALTALVTASAHEWSAPLSPTLDGAMRRTLERLAGHRRGAAALLAVSAVAFLAGCASTPPRALDEVLAQEWTCDMAGADEELPAPAETFTLAPGYGGTVVLTAPGFERQVQYTFDVSAFENGSIALTPSRADGDETSVYPWQFKGVPKEIADGQELEVEFQELGSDLPILIEGQITGSFSGTEFTGSISAIDYHDYEGTWSLACTAS